MGKKVKKNSRQAWKKSEAAKEFEEAMVQVKEQERMENMASDSLFYIDTNGSDRVRKILFEEDIDNPLPETEKRIVRNLKKKMEKKTTTTVPQKAASGTANRDIWGAEPEKKYDSKNFLRKTDFEISYKSKKAPYVSEKPNAYPAVPLPKPGTSYNPDHEQHQDVLGEALALEMEYENRITEEKKLPGNLTKEQLLANTGAMTGDVLASSLLFDEDEDEEALPQEYADEDEEPIYVGPTPDKKIPAAKRRRRQQMEEERRLAEQRREERRRMADVDASKRLVAEHEKKMQEREEERRQMEELKELQEKESLPPLIRGGRVEIPKADVLFTDELSGNLRTMKNISSPLKNYEEGIDRRHLVQRGGAKPEEKFRKLRIKRGVYRNPLY